MSAIRQQVPKALVWFVPLVLFAAPADTVTTLAGSPGVGGHADGAGSAALFLSPKAMSVDVRGNIYTSDNFCGTLRKIDPAGNVITLAGPVSGACAFGSVDGAPADARFASPSGTAVDTAGNVYVADSGNCTVRMVTPGGVVSTLAGVASECVAIDGPKATARFNGLAGITVDRGNNVYVTSYHGCTVRKITPAGTVTTLVGTDSVCATVDGAGAAARLNNPSGIATNGDGNFYVADETGCTIRRITSDGVVTTLAGTPDTCGSSDGTGAAAGFHVPSWTAVDVWGNVFASDYLNFTIRMITPSGVVTTLAGLAGAQGSADGPGTDARLNHPDGIAVDGAGTVYFADRNNNTVREITPSANVDALPAAQVSVTASGLAYSRVTQTYNGVITIRNVSGAPVAGPFEVALASLPPGVSLVNYSDWRSGNPVILVPGVTVLAAGQSATVAIRLTNSSSNSIRFTPILYAEPVY